MEKITATLKGLHDLSDLTTADASIEFTIGKTGFSFIICGSIPN